jgi:hypothetical protein
MHKHQYDLYFGLLLFKNLPDESLTSVVAGQGTSPSRRSATLSSCLRPLWLLTHRTLVR